MGFLRKPAPKHVSRSVCIGDAKGLVVDDKLLDILRINAQVAFVCNVDALGVFCAGRVIVDTQHGDRAHTGVYTETAAGVRRPTLHLGRRRQQRREATERH